MSHDHGEDIERREIVNLLDLGWTPPRVKRLLREASLIADALWRIAYTVTPPLRLRSITPIRKDSAMPFTGTLDPLTGDTLNDYEYAIESDAAGAPVADPLSFFSSDTAVLAFDPPTAGASVGLTNCIGRTGKAGGHCSITISDQFGNVLSQAVTIAGPASPDSLKGSVTAIPKIV